MMITDIFQNMPIRDECSAPQGNKLPRPAQPLKTPSLTCKWSKPQGSGWAELTQDLSVSLLKNFFVYLLLCPALARYRPLPRTCLQFFAKTWVLLFLLRERIWPEQFFNPNHAMTIVLVFAVVMIISSEGAPRRPMSVL